MINFEEKIKTTIEEIRPMLQGDGGDITLVKIEGKDIIVKLEGACHGCPMVKITLKNGIENLLRERVDKEITVIQE